MYNKKHNDSNPNLIVRDDLFCQYCGKQCKNLNSLKQHEIRCKENPGRTACNNLCNKGWAKGLTKETDERIKRNSEIKLEYYKTHDGNFKDKHHTEEHKKYISEVMTEYNHSNNRRNSHGKHGYYDNIYFMSTWELAYYIYSKDTGHNIVRCSKRFQYYDNNGKKHYYTPDFIEDGCIVEVKGWETKLDKIKYQVVENIKVVYYNDIEKMIHYVMEKYGVTDISSLYIGD